MLDDILRNLQTSGYNELASYIPLIIRNIEEIKANNEFAGHTLDRMAKDMQQLIWDRFFDTCSIFMLERYERFLNVKHTEGISISERRANVKLKWNGTGKMSGTRIKEIVKECCNAECDVSFDSSTLNLVFETDFEYLNYIDLLKETFKNTAIPAHIGWLYIVNLIPIIFITYEEISVFVIYLWCLDGTVNLDGSRNLDAFESKEKL